MSKPRLLDLFCGAGGACKGYQRAGFYVVGVDNRPQPRYCGEEFIQADALEYVKAHGHEYDAIHASPPCQAFTSARVIHGRAHPDLLTPTRKALQNLDAAWIIENVPGAPMSPTLILCGSQFVEPRLKRHRWFETSPLLYQLLPGCTHSDQLVSVFGHGGHRYHGVAEWREVMGIDWMNRDELSQAIPPAYTFFIGTQLLHALRSA